MRITVIHNPAAGEGIISRDRLCAALRAAGHEPVYASTRDGGWAGAVQEADDAVLAVGGDGTVTKAARLLIGRAVPLAVLPFGTANNIAETMGVRGDWRDLVREMDTWRAVPFDAGLVHGPWGDTVFLEGVGLGLFADAMVQAKREPADVAARLGRDIELVCDLARVRSLLQDAPPQRCRLRLDGTTSVEADVILLAVMNITSVGPRLRLAGMAQPDDGRLHVMLARERHRAALDAYLEARLEGDEPALELEEHVAESVELACCAGRLHVDDELVQLDGVATARCRMLPGALRVLVPRAD